MCTLLRKGLKYSISQIINQLKLSEPDSDSAGSKYHAKRRKKFSKFNLYNPAAAKEKHWPIKD